MKEKILSAIKAKIGKTDISDKTLNAYVDVIAAQITDESQIETAIAPSIVALKEIQANINSVAANAAKAKETELKSAEEAAKEAAEEAAKKAASGGDGKPEWQKAIEELTATVQTLSVSVQSINAEKTQQTHAQKLAEKLKNVPDWYKTPAITGRVFKDDAEVEAFAESITTQWGATQQTLANQGFQDATPPEMGVPAPNTDSSTIASMIEAGTKQIVEQNTKN